MNDDTLEIEFKQTTVDNIKLFSEMLGKDVNAMLEEALEQYFDSEQKKLMEKNINDDNAMTNLDFDDFWDGLDVD